MAIFQHYQLKWGYIQKHFIEISTFRFLKKVLNSRKDYSEDWYEDKEDFYRDYCSNYVKFLLDSENKKIDEGVKAFARDTVDFYKEQFDKAYAELLEKGYC